MIQKILSRIPQVRAAIIGDICLDIYWQADMQLSHLSRETPHHNLPIVAERMSPGGGGNVAANMAALKPATVYTLGVMGDDWRGMMLEKLLEETGINTSHMIKTPGRFTDTYCKPMRGGISHVVYEDPRLDFTNYQPIPPAAEAALIAGLKAVAGKIDILCISDQLPYSAITDNVRATILDLAAQGLPIVADSRERIHRYHTGIIKPNEVEGMAASGKDNFKEAALALAQQGRDVIMTIGDQGAYYASQGQLTHIPATKITGPIDIVGAGDSFLSAFSLSLAAGATPVEAATIANLASAVTIQKIGTTGTATAEEILNIGG